MKAGDVVRGLVDVSDNNGTVWPTGLVGIVTYHAGSTSYPIHVKFLDARPCNFHRDELEVVTR